MSLASGLVGLGVALLVLSFISWWLAGKPPPFRAVDLHHANTAQAPRLGGLALVAGFLAVELFSGTFGHESALGDSNRSTRWSVVCLAIAMFAVGLRDDLKALGARKKLLFQMLIALLVCCVGIGIQRFRLPYTQCVIELGGWGTVPTVLWLVGMTNLVNLIDGLDGLAGGIGLMLMALLAFAGHGSHEQLVAAGMVGSLLGFLCFNFPPARIYMGDGGAYFLGFLIGLLALISSRKGEILVALVAPMFALALPILDMILAILRRSLRGLPVFRADRRHLHHQLLRLGISPRKVVCSFYFLTLVFLAFGSMAIWSGGRLVPVLLGLAMLILVLCARTVSFSRRWFAAHRTITDALRIRPDVQYALCACKLLGLEGTRRHSVRSLWPELVRAGDRLGFMFIRLSVPGGGDWVWERRLPCQAAYSLRQTLQGGRCGVLELKAPNCLATPSRAACSKLSACRLSFRPHIRDETLFEITSELLAEGWIQAVGNLRKQHEAVTIQENHRAAEWRRPRSPKPCRPM